jgi:hypothetical protein
VESRYLELGLTGLARAGNEWWVFGHFGAAVLAGHYLAERAELSSAGRTTLRHRLDAFVNHHAVWFRPLGGSERQSDATDEIQAALTPSIAGLRHSGHNVIFATLALRALRDAPHMQTLDVVGGIVRILAKLALEASEGGEELSSFEDERGLVRAALDAFARPETLHSVDFAGAVGHIVTFSHALVDLARLGHPDLAGAGHGALRAYMTSVLAEQERGADLARQRTEQATAMPFEPFQETFWNRDLVHFSLGHIFKYAYSLSDLLRSVEDPDLATRAREQMSYVLRDALAS